MTYNVFSGTLNPTQHSVLQDVPQANLLACYRKTNPNTTKAHLHQSNQNVLQHKINAKKTKARFGHLLRHLAW